MIRKLSEGLTLLELLISLAIASILSTIAISSFSTMLARLNQDTVIQGLVTSLSKARTLAVTRAETITLCGMTASGDCASDWGQPYIGAFIDTNDNWARDASDEILFQHAWGADDMSMTWDNFRSHPLIAYQADGTVLSNGTVQLQDDNEPFANVVINVLGRVRVERL